MIKRASIEDKEEFLKYAKNFAEASPYAKYVDLNSIEEMFVSAVEWPIKRICVFMAPGKGMICGMTNPFVYGTVLQATELAWWVEPEFRGTSVGAELIQAFEDWAREKKCTMVTMISLDDLLGKYYEKRGYSLYERAYLKEL